MREFQFETMEKMQSKLSVAIFGPSGSGKTTGALKLAMGIRDELYPGEKLEDIGLYIDTERRSSTKAVGRSVGGESLEALQLYSFEPPYDIDELYNLIEFATSKGKKIIVIDSATAFWSGKDGLLENVADLDIKLADAKKMYGAWSEKVIIHKKNLLKNLMTNPQAHLIVCFRAKTEYALEPNARGKLTPRAIGLKEDMQGDVRYEFDTVLSLDKETHECEIVKDRIGYQEIRSTYDKDNAPLSSNDGKVLAKIISAGISEDELKEKKRTKMINFILDEKLHKSSKVGQLEQANKMEFSKEILSKFEYDKLVKITEFIK